VKSVVTRLSLLVVLAICAGAAAGALIASPELRF